MRNIIAILCLFAFTADAALLQLGTNALTNVQLGTNLCAYVNVGTNRVWTRSSSPFDRTLLVNEYTWISDGTDGSGLGHTAGLSNGASVTSQSVVLDGVSKYVQIPSYSFTNGNDLTVAMWINPVSLGNYHGLATTLDGGLGGWVLEIMADGRIGTYIGGHRISTNGVPTSAWTFVAMTYSNAAGAVSLFQNGGLLQTDTGITLGGSSSGQARLGNLYIDSVISDRMFNGAIGTTRIWKRCLSASEIANLYSLGRFQ